MNTWVINSAIMEIIPPVGRTKYRPKRKYSKNSYTRVVGERRNDLRLDEIIDGYRVKCTCLCCNRQTIMTYTCYKKAKTCDFCAKYKTRSKGGNKLILFDYRNIPNNITFLDIVPVFDNQKVKWKCQHGHVWEADYKSVLSNNCPQCFVSENYVNGIKASQQQLEIALMLELDEEYINMQLLPKIFVDLFMPKLKICVEYDGWH